MTSLTVAQYQAAASSTILTVTPEARKNLNTLSDEDIRKCIGRKKPSTVASLKDGTLKEISLEFAANINANAGWDIFELAPQHIAKIFVQKSAFAQLGTLKLDDRIADISSEIKKLNPALDKNQIYQYLYRWIHVKGEENYTVEIKYAKALEDYFSKKYKIKLFEIEKLFTETVKFKKGQLQSPANPGKKSSVLRMQAKRPREHQEKIPKNQSSKRTKFSNGTSNHHLQKLSSIPSQVPFVEQTSYQAAELTTLNFNQDNPSWLSDPSPSGNGSNIGEASIPTLSPKTTEGTAPFFNQEQQVSDPLFDAIPGNYFPDLNSTSNDASHKETELGTLNFGLDGQSWSHDPLPSEDGSNLGEEYIQSSDINETGENVPFFNQEELGGYPLPEWNDFNNIGEPSKQLPAQKESDEKLIFPFDQKNQLHGFWNEFNEFVNGIK